MMKIMGVFFMMLMYLLLKNKNILIMMYTNSMFFLSLFLLMVIPLNSNMMMMYLWLGMDLYSYMLVLLSLWIIGLMFMVSMNFSNFKMYSLLLLLLLIFLIISFMSCNIFLFYIFFECSMIPTFLLIMGWGYQPERINASMYMMLYTLFSSLPLMILLFYLYEELNSLNFLVMTNLYLMNQFLNHSMMYFYMLFAFLVKLPMFMFHLWLPKAHVEAPLTGSMILAGIMLKLGGYGLMRFMLIMLNFSMWMNYNFIIISIIGFIYLSIICLRQNDMKMLVAYSSVVHMALMLMGIMSLMIWGYNGGFMIMVGHGLCSPAMFYLVNLFYERTKSRNIIMNKGLFNYLPILTMLMFLICISNMASPVTLNLCSELMIFNIMLNWSYKIIFFLMMGMFLSASYNIYIFSYSYHGSNMKLINIYPLSMNNILVVFLHWIPLNFMIMKLEMFM